MLVRPLCTCVSPRVGKTAAAPPASAQFACDVLTNVNISEGAHVSRVSGGDNRKQTGWNWRRAQSCRGPLEGPLKWKWRKLQRLGGTNRCFQALDAGGLLFLFFPTAPPDFFFFFFFTLFLFRVYIVIYVPEQFSQQSSGLGNNSPRACSERHS